MKIITICGSSRFVGAMSLLAWEYEKQGDIVFTPRLLPGGRPGLHGSYEPAESHAAEASGVKEKVDAAYLKKIEMSDAVGHANLKTTEAYLHSTPERVTEIASKIRFGKD